MARSTGFQYLGLLSFSSFLLLDFYFISRLGGAPLSAISIVTPVFMVFLSFLLRIGTGVTILIANRKKTATANPIDFLLGLGVLGLFFSLLFFLFSAKVFSLFTSDQDVLVAIQDYLHWGQWNFILLGGLIGMLSFYRGLHHHQIVFKAFGILAVANLVLDPLLIFGYGVIPAFGIKGASMASFWATIVSVIWTISVRVFPSVRISWNFSSSFAGIRLGFPLAIASAMLPLRDSAIFAMVADIHPQAVAALGIGQRVDVVVQFLFYAVVAAITPALAMFLGSAKDVEAGKLLLAAGGFLMTYSLMAFGLLLTFGESIANIFSSRTATEEFTILYLAIVPFSYLFLAIIQLGNAFLNARKSTRAVGVLSGCSLIFHVVLSLVLLKYLGLEGILWSYVVVAALQAFAVLSLLFRHFRIQMYSTKIAPSLEA